MENYEEIDAILPDDFDINNENYSLDSETQPTEEAAPTTEQPVETNDQATTEESVEVPENTTPLEELMKEEPVKQTVKVKFNHEERELSLDEAAVLAQKGMNYDKLDERVKSFEAANARNERLAKQLGYENAQEMMDAAEKNFFDNQVRELVEAGNTEAMAKFLVTQQMKAAAESIKTPEPQQQEMPTQATPALSPERKAELDEFIMAYPGITKLPPEVVAMNRQGVRLKDAYEKFLNSKPKAQEQKTGSELEKTQAELQVLKQNQASAAMAPVTGVNGKAPMTDGASLDDDPFMKGFNSAY